LARQQGLTEELIAEIPRYQTSALLTPREKAAIHYAEILASDHRLASEALFDELRQYFSEAEIIDLG
jgi:alkylhydroperoxidase family enzyme